MTTVGDVRPLRATGWSDRAGVLRDVARFNLCLVTPSSTDRCTARLGWTDAGKAWPRGLLTSPAAQAVMSSTLGATLQHPPCFDPRRPEWPLALLPETELNALCRQLAAVLLHLQVRQALSRDDVLRWRNWLGPAAWRLAMEGAALLPSWPSPPTVDLEQTSAQDLGLAWLWQASAHWDPAIAERWRLRHDPPAQPWATAVPAERAHRTALSVLFAVQPRWLSRFAH